MPILFEKKKAHQGHVGVITLNRPKQLNAVNLEVCRLMADQIAVWRKDPEIGCIFLHSDLEKAFCAGGDVKAVREDAVKGTSGSFKYVEDFFVQEYRNDYQLTRVEKPIVCWASGITMGGGLGLMQGGSHRVVTENSTLAMPEVSIGLFPDVGAMYWLSKLPPGVGHFFALTGARFGPHDAIELELADFYLKSEMKKKVLEDLFSFSFSDDLNQNHQGVTEILLKHKFAPKLRATVTSHIQALARVARAETAEEAILQIKEIAKTSAWVAESFEILKKGSPLSVAISFEYLKRARDMSRAEVFKTDFRLAINLSLRKEFAEGVRSLLVDKDNRPNWMYAKTEDVPAHEIINLFEDPYQAPSKLLTYTSNPFDPILTEIDQL